MIGTSQTRRLGWAMRIYRNSNNKIIASDCIEITADKRRISKEQFHRSAYLHYDRTTYHLAVGNRSVTLIQMLGDYSSVEDATGNYLNATWDASTDNENDVTIDLSSLPQLGDVL